MNLVDGTSKQIIDRYLYAGQEAAVRPGHGTTNWFNIGKGVHQGCILSPYLTYMQSTSCKTPVG